MSQIKDFLPIQSPGGNVGEYFRRVIKEDAGSFD